MASSELKRQVAGSSKWAFLGELVAKLLTPAIFLILARVLSPADFGIAASAVMVITFSQLLWEAGLGKAIIQREEHVEAAATIAFWSNVGLALVVYTVIFVSADLLAQTMGDSRIAAVLRVQGLQIPIMAIGSVHRALLQRRFAFKNLFWVRLCATGMPAVASLPLAWFGWGYWALVAGSLIGALTEALVLWIQSAWQPGITINRSLVRSVWLFGLPVMGEGLLLWGIAWGDAFIVGRYLGAEALGYYRGGGSLVTMLFTLALSPLLPLLFSALSRLQNDPVGFRAAFLKAVHVIALISLPLAAVLVCLAREMVLVALGRAWLPAVEVVAMLGIMQSFSWLVGANPEAYRAKGRPDINLKVNALNICYYLPLLWWAVQSGMDTFLLTRVGVAAVAFPIHVYLGSKLLGVRVGEMFRQLRWVLLAVALQVALMLAIKASVSPDTPPLVVLLSAGIGGATGLAAGLWVEWHFIRELLRSFFGRN